MTSQKIYGLIGYPVKHSLSPAMHNAAFRALRINSEYKLFEKKPEELDEFFASLSKQNIYGLNVTIPYKEIVIKYLNGYKSYGVRIIGAVNTIVVGKDCRLRGFNTDYLGFSRHISELKLKPKRVAIIGAGGAAKAVCYALAKKDAEEIFIYDIDKNKSIGLVERFKGLFPKCKFLAADSIQNLETKNKDILINASPVGMKKDDPCLIDSSMLHSDIFIYDLIYNPVETKLLELAKNLGVRTSNGLKMLFYQAIIPFEKWTHKNAPQEVMWQALNEAVNKL